MTSVAAFFIGLLCGALLATLVIISRYGTDADDYYEGSNRK